MSYMQTRYGPDNCMSDSWRGSKIRTVWTKSPNGSDPKLLLLCTWSTSRVLLGRVVQKVISANPGLKFNRLFILVCSV